MAAIVEFFLNLIVDGVVVLAEIYFDRRNTKKNVIEPKRNRARYVRGRRSIRTGTLLKRTRRNRE